MKKLLFIPALSLLSVIAACNGHSSDAESSDSTKQEGPIPAGDQSGSIDRMNNTSDHPDTSTERKSNTGSTDDNRGNKTEHYTRPGPGMDTLTRNTKSNGDSRRTII
jgi:hypothetical protein